MFPVDTALEGDLPAEVGFPELGPLEVAISSIRCDLREPSLDIDLTRRPEVLAYAVECFRAPRLSAGPRRAPRTHRGASFGRDRARVEVEAALLGQALCAFRYAVTTEAGSLPRSLTVNPFLRAHERTSALLEVSTERRAVFCFDRAAAVLVEGTTSRACLAADGALFTVRLLPAGLLALFLPRLVAVFLADLVPSWSSGETTSVTPYSAPRTRIASSRGSLESSVSFKTITFRHVRGTAAGRHRSATLSKEPAMRKTALCHQAFTAIPRKTRSPDPRTRPVSCTSP